MERRLGPGQSHARVVWWYQSHRCVARGGQQLHRKDISTASNVAALNGPDKQSPAPAAGSYHGLRRPPSLLHYTPCPPPPRPPPSLAPSLLVRRWRHPGCSPEMVLPEGGRLWPAMAASATHDSSMLNTDSLMAASTTWPAPPLDLQVWGVGGRGCRGAEERITRDWGFGRCTALLGAVACGRLPGPACLRKPHNRQRSARPKRCAPYAQRPAEAPPRTSAGAVAP
jgi:hypothetical protein